MNEQAFVYICAIPEGIPRETEALLLGGLPQFRRDKAERYMRSGDRLLSAAAWQLMRYAVRDAAGIDAFSLAVHTDGLRKPRFAENIGVHFNLSHCREAVVCAVSPYPCGVDIEPLRAADPRIARRFMRERYDALMRTAKGAERDEFFTRCWTEAESVYKSGAADGVPPEGCGVAHFRHGIYYIALCARAATQAEPIEVAFGKLITNH
jgi:4'-phosphopantetheinyl transferase